MSETARPADKASATTHDSHNAVVTGQFGPQASAYLTSANHAQGADLEQLAAIARAHPNAQVLDLGCGAGHVSFFTAPHVARVVAYDLSADMLGVVSTEAAKRGMTNIDTQLGAAESLPFPDASFDLVFSRYSAHHWADVGAALREMRDSRWCSRKNARSMRCTIFGGGCGGRWRGDIMFLVDLDARSCGF